MILEQKIKEVQQHIKEVQQHYGNIVPVQQHISKSKVSKFRPAQSPAKEYIFFAVFLLLLAFISRYWATTKTITSSDELTGSRITALLEANRLNFFQFLTWYSLKKYNRIILQLRPAKKSTKFKQRSLKILRKPPINIQSPKNSITNQIQSPKNQIIYQTTNRKESKLRYYRGRKYIIRLQNKLERVKNQNTYSQFL